jgi:hypothetical protein
MKLITIAPAAAVALSSTIAFAQTKSIEKANRRQDGQGPAAPEQRQSERKPEWTDHIERHRQFAIRWFRSRNQRPQLSVQCLTDARLRSVGNSSIGFDRKWPMVSSDRLARFANIMGMNRCRRCSI